ncbi:hypothetical protein O3G_MSEX005142 [Manduca sexta]|uniref:Uncharacterized protein n=1 Tax=Manduca sexta TaxID=7130 RepID=A0A922CIW2_MANSE|nr:hypothetical protein O3G_MSEX005142 [Manduca sexta]
MAYLRTTLVVLTLLQLCRAEISDKQPEWYSANVINDGFQPKPISELFSTESSFSSTNPIIVLSKSSEIPDEISLLSTLKPPTRSISSTLEDFINSLPTSTVPSTVAISETPSSSTPPTSSPTIPVQVQTEPQETSAPPFLPNVPPAPPEIQPVIPLVTREPPSVQQSQNAQLPQMKQPISPVGQLDLSVQAPIQPLIVSNQSTSGLPSRSQSSQNQSQQIRLELVPQVQNLPVLPISNVPEISPQQIVTQLPIQSSTPSPQSNYFLIYQQAPQNIQNYPLPQPPGLTSSQAPMIPTVTTQPSIPQPIPTVSAPSIPSSPPQTVPPTASSPSRSTNSVPSSPQTVSTVNNTMPTTRTLPTTSPPATANCQNTARPLLSTTTPIPRTEPPLSLLPLRIRVIAPSGSITNVNINPTTTTKKPKTPRTRKPKPKARKNSYDVCIDSCKGRRDPICAGPLSPGLIDPKDLKGFPSICHMACHNSFRKDTYEKLVDGRCGKLRTRIRTVDSNTKLKRDELIKSEYTLDNTGPKTIFQFSGSIN